jgi:hypothetical protein
MWLAFQLICPLYGANKKALLLGKNPKRNGAYVSGNIFTDWNEEYNLTTNG